MVYIFTTAQILALLSSMVEPRVELSSRQQRAVAGLGYTVRHLYERS